MPDNDQISRLQERVDQLSSELARLRQRVADLERGATPQIATPVIAMPIEAKPAAGAWLKLLNRAGALTLFIGTIFFFKYAVDNQWIGASGRVVLGALVGIGLIGCGEFLRKRGQIVFAQGLSSCGVATLFISSYAASEYYKLIGSAAGFFLFLVIAAATLVLSNKSSDPVLALVGYLGAIAAPGLFRFLGPAAWSWIGFVYLFGIQTLVFWQARVLSSSLLIPVTATAISVQAFWVINPRRPIVCVLFLLALAALQFRPPGQKGPIAAQSYVIAHILVLLAGFRFLVFWFRTVSSPETRRSLLSETGSIFLGIYGVALLASAVFRKSTADRIIGLTLLGLVMGKLYVFDVWLLTRFYRISAFIALGLVLLAASFVYSHWKQSGSGT